MITTNLTSTCKSIYCHHENTVKEFQWQLLPLFSKPVTLDISAAISFFYLFHILVSMLSEIVLNGAKLFFLSASLHYLHPSCTTKLF